MESISREYQVVITPVVRTSGPGLEVVEGFKLNCLQSAKESTATVKEMLDQFLITHSVQVYPATNTRVHKRVDSFADAFPHFDSKLLSHPKTRGGKLLLLWKLFSVTNFYLDSADFGRPHVNGSVERRLRLANSSPNVKALFNNSPATYNYPLDDDDDSNYMAAPSDYWNPLPPIVSLAYSWTK